MCACVCSHVYEQLYSRRKQDSVVFVVVILTGHLIARSASALVDRLFDYFDHFNENDNLYLATKASYFLITEISELVLS